VVTSLQFLIYDVYNQRTLKFLLYIFKHVLKQNIEQIHAADAEYFKWIFDRKDIPYLFEDFNNEFIENINIDEIINEKLDVIRTLKENLLEKEKQDNDYNNNSFISHFNKRKNESAREFYAGRILTLEKFFIHFPEFLVYYHDTLDILMLDNNGSLPITWRYFIAIMVIIHYFKYDRQCLQSIVSFY